MAQSSKTVKEQRDGSPRADDGKQARLLVKSRALQGLLDLTHGRISQLTKEGVLERVDTAGNYDLYQAIPSYLNLLRTSRRPGGGGPVVTDSLNQSKAREAKAKADMAERAAAKQAGELVEIDTITRGWSAILGKVRTRLLALPTKLAPLVAVERELDACQRVLTDHMESALQELSDESTVEAVVALAARSAAGDDEDGVEFGAEATAEADG